MHLIKRFSFLLICFSMSMFLSACGSKGDLYHPSEPKADQNVQDKAHQEESKQTKKKPS